MKNILKNKGFTILGMTIGTAIVTMIAVVGIPLSSAVTFFSVRQDLSSDIQTNKSEIARVETKHNGEVEGINGRLDLLLKNFNLQYVPKK